MKRFLCVMIISALCSASAMAAKIGKDADVTSMPEFYFLQASQSVDSLVLLPPPPTPDSVEFLLDKTMYDAGKMLRSTPRGKQAAADAHVEGDGIAISFSASFGMPINSKDTPEIFTLLLKMREDAGDLATRSAKQHYMRIRPFAFYHEATCAQQDETKLSTNGSYPSGHTTIGWATALVLAEINPDRQNEILKRGYEMGQSRVICGYHWQSDIHAGRIVGSAIVARLHSELTFIEQLNKAKAEFAKLAQ